MPDMNDFSLDVTTANFKEAVFDTSLNVPVVVDFWAEWCGPCKVLKPILEKLAAEYAGRFILAKVDSDTNPELAQHFGIRSIPTVAAIVNGEIVDGFTGAKTEPQVREWLSRFVPEAAPEAAPAESDTCEAIASLLEAGDLSAAHEMIAGALETYGRTEALEPLIARFTHLQQQASAAAAAAPQLAAQEAAVSAAPDDLAVRLELINTLTEVGEYRRAFEHLIAGIRIDRSWNEEAMRKRMIELFNQLNEEATWQPLVREFRSQLARTLN